MGGFWVRMKPRMMEEIYSSEDGYEYKAPDKDEEKYDGWKNELNELEKRLNGIERDILNLYFRKGKNQEDIAKIFDLSQAAISYRIDRIQERLRFLEDIEIYDQNSFHSILNSYCDKYISPNEKSILWKYYMESSFQTVADMENKSYGQVKDQLDDALYKISDHALSVENKDPIPYKSKSPTHNFKQIEKTLSNNPTQPFLKFVDTLLKIRNSPHVLGYYSD